MFFGQDLEDEPAEGSRWIGRTLDRDGRLLRGVEPFHRRHIEGAGKVEGDRIEHRLDADAVERRSAEYRHDAAGEGRLADRLADHADRDRRFVHRQFGKFIREVEEGGDELLAPLRGEIGDVVRDRPHDEGLSRRVPLEDLVPRRIREELHLHEIDKPPKGILDVRRPHPEGHVEHQRLGAEAFFDLADGAEKVGPLPVELVDERHARHVVLVGLPPYRLALRLHPLASREHDHRTVEDAQRSLHLGGEIDVAGGVDEVHRHVPPAEAHGCGVDRDPAFLLLGIEVGDGRPLVDVAEAVARLGVKEHPLGERGLAGVDVGDDADVADAGQLPAHDLTIPR